MLRTAMGTVAVGLLPTLAACGSLDESKAEESIKSDIERDTGARAVKVDCPGDVEQKKGENFDCSATVDGQKINVPVTQKDDDGNISYSPELVATREVEQTVERRVNQALEITSGAKAQCPTVVPLERGKSFGCTVQTPGPNYEAAVRQANDRGRVTYRIRRTSG